MSPLMQETRARLSLRRDNNLIAWGCGIAGAVLMLAYILDATK